MTHRVEHLAEGVSLYLDDCREVLPSIPHADAIITDPPYGNANHDGDWNARLNDHRGIENKPIQNDTAEGMREVVDAMLTEAARLLSKEASACCCFCGGGGLDLSLLGLPSGWIVAAFNSFTLSSGTSGILASARDTAGSMK